MQAPYTIQHSPYTGSTDNQGYPTDDEFGPTVNRQAYGWSPGQGNSGSSASAVNGGGDYDRRVVSYKVLLLPDVAPFHVRDRVVLPGDGDLADRTYFVSADVRDYSTGPFGFKPSPDATAFGEIVLEKITG